ncbi:MAG TPA: hypothetical protein DCP90_08880 [Clostridiales bacterium]|nr:MAG: hypothetical protein A2Y22_03310 [Clostridiales bacterium GWD2_32_59]HAN10709.1 hypothetical protein [Clostridiales bacterium]
MQSIYWYYSLAIIGIVVAIFTIYKKRRVTEISTFIMFYIFVTCITWIGEFTALGLFNGYIH